MICDSQKLTAFTGTSTISFTRICMEKEGPQGKQLPRSLTQTLNHKKKWFCYAKLKASIYLSSSRTVRDTLVKS